MNPNQITFIIIGAAIIVLVVFGFLSLKLNKRKQDDSEIIDLLNSKGVIFYQHLTKISLNGNVIKPTNKIILAKEKQLIIPYVATVGDVVIEVSFSFSGKGLINDRLYEGNDFPLNFIVECGQRYLICLATDKELIDIEQPVVKILLDETTQGKSIKQPMNLVVIKLEDYLASKTLKLG